MKQILISATIILLLTCEVFAQSAFEGTQGTVTREALDIYGGQVEDIQVASNGNVYVALNSPNGIFCSGDKGVTWSGPPSGSDFGTISGIALGEDADTIYLIGGIDLYKTDDACQSFSVLQGSADSNNFGQDVAYGGGVLVVPVRDGATVDVSTDNGATFTNYTIDNGFTSISDIAASSNSGEFFALVSDEFDVTTLYFSSDSGQSWTAKSLVDDYTKVAIDPNDGDVVVATSQESFAISTDKGGTFPNVGSNPSPRPSISFAKQPGASAGTSEYIIVGNNRTDDLGSTWTNLDSSATTKDSELFAYVAQDPTDNNLLYIYSLRGVAKSTDFGTNWSDSVEGMLGVQIYSIAQATDKDIVYLGALGGLAKSTDYTTTKTWTYPIDVAGNGSNVDAVFVNPDDPDTILAASGGIYKSTDGGANWTEASMATGFAIDGEVKEFAATDDGTLYAAFGNRNDNDGGMAKSTDNGDTWSEASIPNSPFVNTILAVGDVLYAGVGTENDSTATMRGVYKLESATWTQLSGDVEGHKVNDLEYNGTYVFVAGGDVNDGGLFRTSNGGTTWEDLSSQITESRCTETLAYDPNDANDIYVATGCPAGEATIFKSEDGGTTWDTHYEGLKDEVPAVMLVDGLIAGLNTGAYTFEDSADSGTSGYTLTFRKINSRKRTRRGKTKYYLRGFVKDSEKNKIANQSVVLLYRKHKKKDFTQRGKAKSSNAKGRVQWASASAGKYKLQLESNSSVESRARRIKK